MRDWLQLAFSGNVVRRALIMAGIVGPVLVLINQGEYLLDSSSGSFSWTKLVLTFLVPYIVSMVSSVTAIRQTEKQVND
jgi:hypothetical protein